MDKAGPAFPGGACPLLSSPRKRARRPARRRGASYAPQEIPGSATVPGPHDNIPIRGLPQPPPGTNPEERKAFDPPSALLLDGSVVEQWCPPVTPPQVLEISWRRELLCR